MIQKFELLQTENWKGQKEARIVENGKTKIWYTFLSRSEGYLTKVVSVGPCLVRNHATFSHLVCASWSSKTVILQRFPSVP